MSALDVLGIIAMVIIAISYIVLWSIVEKLSEEVDELKWRMK